MEADKVLELNGVQIGIKKLDAFQQFDIVNRYLLPMFTKLNLDGSIFNGGVNLEVIYGILFKSLSGLEQTLDADKREIVVFKYLLKPENVEIVANGVRVPFCVNKTIQCEPLNNAKALISVAIEAMRLNFEDFFTTWQIMKDWN